MVREIEVNEDYMTTKVFDEIKIGDIVKIPFEKSRHSGIKSEAARRHRDARLLGKKVTNLDPIYRISEKEYPGFTTIIRIK